MKVKKLIELLGRFDSEAEARLSVSMPGRVISTHENIWVGDYGGGPQINAALDFKQFHVYVGCGIEQFVTPVPQRRLQPVARREVKPEVIDLGHYDDEEVAVRIRDFYVYHRGLDEPLRFPDFDYESWIPPRTSSGEYNEHIAEILKEKLLKD